MARYEAHITADVKDERAVAQVGKLEGWVFSRIAGCPILGQGTYCYLTNYAPEAEPLRAAIESVVGHLRDRGVEVLRSKMERIVYDTKTGVDEIAFESR
jgi:hypothetical protein